MEKKRPSIRDQTWLFAKYIYIHENSYNVLFWLMRVWYKTRGYHFPMVEPFFIYLILWSIDNNRLHEILADLQVCKDQAEVEVWFSTLEALIASTPGRKSYSTDGPSDRLSISEVSWYSWIVVHIVVYEEIYAIIMYVRFSLSIWDWYSLISFPWLGKLSFFLMSNSLKI